MVFLLVDRLYSGVKRTQPDIRSASSTCGPINSSHFYVQVRSVQGAIYEYTCVYVVQTVFNGLKYVATASSYMLLAGAR